MIKAQVVITSVSMSIPGQLDISVAYAGYDGSSVVSSATAFSLPWASSAAEITAAIAMKVRDELIAFSGFTFTPGDTVRVLTPVQDALY